MTVFLRIKLPKSFASSSRGGGMVSRRCYLSLDHLDSQCSLCRSMVRAIWAHPRRMTTSNQITPLRAEHPGASFHVQPSLLASFVDAVEDLDDFTRYRVAHHFSLCLHLSEQTPYCISCSSSLKSLGKGRQDIMLL